MRLKPLVDFLAPYLDEIIYVVRSPIEGWYLGARNLPRLEREVEAVRLGGLGRNELVAIARAMSGAEPHVVFNALREALVARLAGAEGLYSALMELWALLAIVMAMYGVIPIIGTPQLLMGLPPLAIIIWLMKPGDHYLEFTRRDLYASLVAIGLGSALSLLVNAVVGVGSSLVIMGAYSLPSVMRDWETANGVGRRVGRAFGELVMKPRPEKIRDLTPIEASLIRLYNDTKRLGAPELAGWASALVQHYLGVLGRVRQTILVYGLVTTAVATGVAIGVPYMVIHVLALAGAQSMMALGGVSGMGISKSLLRFGAILAGFTVGFLGGTEVFDPRLGLLISGALGLIAYWVV